MLNRIIFCFLAFAMLNSASASAWAQERFALVIGNSEYQSVTSLPNPVRDAKAVTDLLRATGFEVTSALNLDQTNLRSVVNDFATKLADKAEDTVALVYFAGHGMQLDGKNYLLPIDAKLTREADVALQAVRLEDVMNVLNTIPSKTRIVILDACRNNPFETASDKSGRGLARVNDRSAEAKTARGLALVNAPPGTLVAYSTSPGATADDGTGENSPFTAALIEAAKEPGAAIGTVFQNVRLAVHKKTQGRQTPWEVTAITVPFSFIPGDKAPVVDQTPEKSDREWRQELRSFTPEQAYETVVVQNNVTVYQIFLAIYPDTQWGQIIQGLMVRRLEMLAWFDAVSLNSEAAFQAFLKLYPNSDLTQTTKRLLKRAQQRSLFAKTSPGALPVATTPEVKTVIKQVFVPSPPEIKTVIKEVFVKSPPEIRTVIKEVRVPVVRVKTVIKRVPVVKVKTVIKRVPVRVPCNCRGTSRPNRRGQAPILNPRLRQNQRLR